MQIEKASFGKTAEGTEVDHYIITNGRGTILKLITYGAAISVLETADCDGKRGNIALGLDSLSAYERHDAYFGATIGRFANRIAGGRFNLDDEDYELATNNGLSHLHGGVKGFDKVVWEAETIRSSDEVGIRFSYTSVDGEEGFPGTLDVTVLYTLNNDDELRIEYSARTDARTVVNLTNHTYWNLSAGRSETILDHLVQIEADQFLKIDKHSIPTVARAVKGTAMDFTSAVPIGERIAELKAEVNGPLGYDHCYVLREGPSQLVPAARVEDPISGRIMEVLTSEPGIQFYSGNYLDGGESSGGYPQHAALCFETQHFPDSPNRPDFPSVELEPGELFQSITVFRFAAGCVDITSG